MSKRCLLAITALPLLAQNGCSEQDVVGLVTVVLQTLLTTLIPLLISTVLGGGTTGLGL